MRAVGRLVRRLLVIALVPTVLDGCLVVSDPEFRGQDECVPFFLTHEADPSTSLPLRRPETASDPAEFRATVPMRSCALVSNYKAHVFVDRNLKIIKTLPPTGTELRDVSVLVNIADEVADGRCHRVEVLVSQNFLDFENPARAGDVAKITWQFYNDPNTTLADCPTE
jgi:hypothetical protein